MSHEDGLGRLLSFLRILTEKGVEFKLEQRAPDSISVDFSLVGMRIEVDFDVDGMQYSVFHGDESVSVDAEALARLISERTA